MSERTYHRHMRQYAERVIRCPVETCRERCTLKEYVYEHVSKCHQWTVKRQCVFCVRSKRWAVGQRDFQHMVPCLKNFLKEAANVEEEEEAVPTPCADCKHFRSMPRQMWGRKKDRLSHYVKFYDPVCQQPEAYWKSDIECTQQSGLGRDIYGIVQRFLKGDLEWYHLMVVHQNFNNFVKAMETMKDRMFLLPFWCLCDGMGPNRRTHRHMIIAFEPEAPFKHLWTTKVKYDFGDGSKSKNCIRIKNAFHLIRTIQYVSQRKSSCDGIQIQDEVTSQWTYSHFHINRPLHEHAIVCMCTMFEGGMESLLKEQHRNKDVVGWLKNIQTIRDEHRNPKYAVPIGVTEFKFMECVLPLASYYEPTEERTEVHLTWLGSKKMYLRINPSLKKMSRDDWYAHQAAKGNTVWSIRHEWYVLSPRQQNMMNQIKVVLDETSEMEKKYQRMKEKCEEILAEKAAVEAKYATLEVKYAASEAERIRLIMESEKKKENESQMLRCQNLNIALHQTIYDSSGSKKEE